ncbi:MAG: hypothetical protein Q8P67_12030 [archaeon]|nr:hypothetical protein [archaeon]
MIKEKENGIGREGLGSWKKSFENLEWAPRFVCLDCDDLDFLNEEIYTPDIKRKKEKERKTHFLFFLFLLFFF